MNGRIVMLAAILLAATDASVWAQPQQPAAQPQQSSQPQRGSQPQQSSQPQPTAGQQVPQPSPATPVGTSGQVPATQPQTQTPGGAQPSVPAPTNAACPPPVDVSTALPLLDRIQRLLD